MFAKFSLHLRPFLLNPSFIQVSVFSLFLSSSHPRPFLFLPFAPFSSYLSPVLHSPLSPSHPSSVPPFLSSCLVTFHTSSLPFLLSSFLPVPSSVRTLSTTVQTLSAWSLLYLVCLDPVCPDPVSLDPLCLDRAVCLNSGPYLSEPRLSGPLLSGPLSFRLLCANPVCWTCVCLDLVCLGPV